MDLQLQDQHVLITGGSRGIGLACARQFLAEGARVYGVPLVGGHTNLQSTAQVRTWWQRCSAARWMPAPMPPTPALLSMRGLKRRTIYTPSVCLDLS